mmetsp:Transcript_20215/g.69399  ORF Transcript_20215/g.69399 Transcript_20215/m.69399 type:complete len:221 (-) Transcript_20215:2937-3599(-)
MRCESVREESCAARDASVVTLCSSRWKCRSPLSRFACTASARAAISETASYTSFLSCLSFLSWRGTGPPRRRRPKSSTSATSGAFCWLQIFVQNSGSSSLMPPAPPSPPNDVDETVILPSNVSLSLDVAATTRVEDRSAKIESMSASPNCWLICNSRSLSSVRSWKAPSLRRSWSAFLDGCLSASSSDCPGAPSTALSKPSFFEARSNMVRSKEREATSL